MYKMSKEAVIELIKENIKKVLNERNDILFNLSQVSRKHLGEGPLSFQTIKERKNIKKLKNSAKDLLQTFEDEESYVGALKELI